MKIAIIGGGAGGLCVANFLDEYSEAPLEIDIFESSNRLGGKIITASFEQGAKFEAGAAEFYDYSAIGEDPLRQLIADLKLTTQTMKGSGVVLGDTIIPTFDEMARICGVTASNAAQSFFDNCARILTPQDFYGDDPDGDNEHPLSQTTMREFLDGIEDETARRYVETAIHSDLATEPHSTTALYGIKNVLLDDERYAGYYCIDGGNERLIESLRSKVPARINLQASVKAVEQLADARLALSIATSGGTQRCEYDAVAVALPNYWLSGINWLGAGLRQVIGKHESHFDQPAHYLRVTILFRAPFWRRYIGGSWFMHDAFGGCCVYDESSRHPTEDGTGVLSWLIAGTNAMALATLDDDNLINRILGSLPSPMAVGRKQFMAGKVHRWIGTVSALPGGKFAMPMGQRHHPSPTRHPNLYLAGDYMHDTTLNGVLDAAEFVASCICDDSPTDGIPLVGTAAE